MGIYDQDTANAVIDLDTHVTAQLTTLNATITAISGTMTTISGTMSTISGTLTDIKTQLTNLNTNIIAPLPTLSINNTLSALNTILNATNLKIDQLIGIIDVLVDAFGPLNTSVSSLTRVDDVATAVVTNHGLSTGDLITISGAVQTQYNGTFKVTVVDVNTFTYSVSGIPVTPATGTIIATFASSLTTSIQTLKNYTNALSVEFNQLVTAFGSTATQSFTQNMQDIRDDTREGLEMSIQQLTNARLPLRVVRPVKRP